MSALLTTLQLGNMRRQPSKYAGLQHFDYTPQGTELALECWLEFEAAQNQTRDDPGSHATATLCRAEVNGVDLLEIIAISTVDEIEDAFLLQALDV